MLVAFGAAHLDTIARLEHPPGPSSIPARVDRFAGGAAFNATRQFVRAGGQARLHTPGPIARLKRESAGVDLRPIGENGPGEPSYTAVLDPDGDLVVGFADMRAYDDLQSAKLEGVERAKHVLLDANLSAAFLEGLIGSLARGTRLYAMAVSPAKIGRLAAVADRIDILFANRHEMGAHPLPVRASVVTDGAKGLAFTSAEGTITHEPIPIAPVDVTGAGDAVVGAFLQATIAGSDVPNALARAATAASETIVSVGPFPFLDRA